MDVELFQDKLVHKTLHFIHLTIVRDLKLPTTMNHFPHTENRITYYSFDLVHSDKCLIHLTIQLIHSNSNCSFSLFFVAFFYFFPFPFPFSFLFRFFLLLLLLFPRSDNHNFLHIDFAVFRFAFEFHQTTRCNKSTEILHNFPFCVRCLF